MIISCVCCHLVCTCFLVLLTCLSHLCFLCVLAGGTDGGKSCKITQRQNYGENIICCVCFFYTNFVLISLLSPFDKWPQALGSGTRKWGRRGLIGGTMECLLRIVMFLEAVPTYFVDMNYFFTGSYI